MMHEPPSPDGEDRLSIRPISMEDAFGRQNDRIAYLRSLGQPWGEAVFELRDLLHGLEDEEFWDGLPPTTRTHLEGLQGRLEALRHPDAPRALDDAEEAAARRLGAEIEAIRAHWSPHGWNGMPVRAFPGPGGRPVWRPTPEDLSNALRIIRRLANRCGITWRKKRATSLPGYEHDEEVPPV